jgi:nucleoside-diphosphate-sugar epimerase
MAQRILITGGTGFIGSRLAKTLFENGDDVTVFAHTTSHPFLKGLKLKFMKGDIRNYKEIFKATQGKDYVYHLAATTKNSPSEKQFIFDTNVLGTENVARACLEAEVKKMVYAGSSATLGFTRKEKALTEHDVMDFKDNLYGQSKKLGEDKVQEYIAKGLHASIFIPSYVLGGGEVDPERFGLWKSINKGRIRFTFPGGSSLVPIDDLVEGIILVMKKGRKGERYILSSTYMRLYDFYNLIAYIMGKPKIRWRIPHWTYHLAYLSAIIMENTLKKPPLTTEAVRWHFNYKMLDASKARQELGWKPKTKVEDSIKELIAYYKSRGILT